MKNYRKIYKSLATGKKLNRYHIVQYAVLKAIDLPWITRNVEQMANQASYYISKAFTPISRKSKLDNGRVPLDTLHYTINGLSNYNILDNVNLSDIFTDISQFEEYKAIIELLKKKYSFFKTKEYWSRHYVYIFVRQDMSPEYQLVQAAHAAAKMGYRLGTKDTQAKMHAGPGEPPYRFDELYFAVIGVADLAEMAVALNDCKELGLNTYTFIEPDIGNVMTAFATDPIRADQRKRLLSYKKLKFKKS